MRIHNIARVQVFRELRNRVFTLEEIARHYPILPAGTLIYYGFGSENVEHFHATGLALNDGHRTVLDDLILSLQDSTLDEMTFQLVVGPSEKEAAFEFVDANMDVMQRIAVELDRYQNKARASGKRLNVVLRYASEMNDAADSTYTGYKGRPDGFKRSFAAVRTLFARHAPRVVFPFSPALRADLDPAKNADYWPGDEFVDVIGATWYVHGENQRARGMAHMRDWFRHPIAAGKPFAIDEFGGAEGEDDHHYFDNDVMLQDMLHEIEGLALHGITFAYGTIFLDDGKYGVDARLRFLEPPKGWRRRRRR